MDTFSFLQYLTSVLLAIFAFYNYKKLTFWSSRGVKGPMPWPIFGTNGYYFFETKIELETRWHKKYGKTFGLYDGYLPTLKTVDNELIKFVYIKKFDSFMERNHRTIHNDNRTNWLLWSTAERWNNQRALVAPMFTAAKTRSMCGTMADVVDRFLVQSQNRIREEQQRLAKATGGHEHQADSGLLEASRRVEFSRNDMLIIALDVIAQLFYSLKLNLTDNQEEFVQRALKFSQFDFKWFVMWQFIPNFLARIFKLELMRFSQIEYFDRLSQNVIDNRRNNKGNRQNDVIQALLEAKIPDKYENVYSKDDDAESHYNASIDHQELERIQHEQIKRAKLFRNFSDTEIRGLMTFFFVAGFDTTATTMTFSMYMLAHHPKEQQMIYEELKKKFCPADSPDEIKDIEYSDLTGLKCLDAFVSEMMRLYGPIVEATRLCTDKHGVRLPTEPKIVLPYYVAVSTNLFVLHRQPDYFENPDEFDMSRFYPENRDKIKSCSYMPFGVGPRNCAGMRMGLMGVKMFLAKLLLKYSVSPGEKSQVYPPELMDHFVFLLFKNTDFKLAPREVN